MKKHLLLMICLLSLVVLTACTEDPIILKKICSKNSTYCEDLMKTNGINTTSWENLTTVLDSRSVNNLTYWENIT